MSTLRERFGRPLRLAVIGGGPGAWIGTMHRGAAEMDGHWKVVADKPVAHDFAQACDLVQRTRKGGRLFAVAHGYSAYPMTRYARHLVREGVLGDVRLVQVEYIQSGLATRVEDGPPSRRFEWILDPKRSGLALVMGAIGCHAQHLACFVADASVARVSAEVGALMPGRVVVDHVSALLAFDNGARGTFTVTQAAAGAENDIRLRVFGAKGSLEWSHRQAGYLQLSIQGEAPRTIGRGDVFLPPEILAAGRTPRGHPEGLREAFSNIYNEVAAERMALALGETPPQAPYPRIADGAHTMAFIEACIRSHKDRNWADVVALPLA